MPDKIDRTPPVIVNIPPFVPSFAEQTEPLVDVDVPSLVPMYEQEMNPRGRLGAVTRKMNEIKPFLKVKSEENLVHVKNLLEEYDDKVGNFEEACDSEFTKKITVEETQKFKSYMETALQVIREFRNCYKMGSNM
jgi:hypothetical protein